MSYEIRFTKQAAKDVAKLTPKLREKLMIILRNRIAKNPHQGKPLVGELAGYHSARLSYKDRIVYVIDEDAGLVLVHRARTHYGD